MSGNADVDFLKDITFGSNKFWFGLRKNSSSVEKIDQNQDDIFTIGDECAIAKLNESPLWQLKIVPCSWLRASFCLKGTTGIQVLHLLTNIQENYSKINNRQDSRKTCYEVSRKA